MAEIIVPTAPTSVNLNGSEPLVLPGGQASPYFLRYLFDQNGYLTQGAQELAALIEAINTVQVQAGGALTVTPNPGLIVNNPTISLDALSPDPSGTYTNSNIEVDEYGRVVSASSGGGGAGALPLTRAYVPEISSWSVLNGTGATITEKTASGGVTKALQVKSVAGASSGSPNIQGLYRTAPTPPYRIVCGWLPSTLPLQYPFSGFGFYDGTKLLSIIYVPSGGGANVRIVVAQHNSVTSLSSEPYSITTYMMGGMGPVWFAWENTGTDLKAQIGSDSVGWNTFYSQGVGAWLANRDYLYFGVSNNEISSAFNTIATIIEWDEDGLGRTLDNVNFG